MILSSTASASPETLVKLEDGVLALSGEERIVIDWARPPEGSLPKAELKSVQVGLFKDKKLYEYKGYQGLSYIDRSFFKIKRISLGYTLPKQLSRKARMENLRIYATVTDPFHWSKSDWMDGYDPEGLARSVVFGVNLTF